MTLEYPFCISNRLMPSLRIGKAWLSYKGNFEFYLDFEGKEHLITDYSPGGKDKLEDIFEGILFWLSISPELDPQTFPEWVVAWAADNQDEIESLRNYLEEREEDLIH